MYLASDGITEEEYVKVKGMVLRSVHKNLSPPSYERP
jgi:hypothetical protein